MNIPHHLFKKAFFAFTVFFLFPFASKVSAQSHDVVQLKNGSVIKGEIIEQVPNQSIKIKTADGNIFVYKMDEVDKISKEAAPVAPLGVRGRRGFYLGIHLDPAATDVYIDQYKNNITVNGKFLGGVSIGGYLSDHVGLMSGLRIEQYGSTYKNVAIGYTTYYSYYGAYTTLAYGDAQITMTYLTIPLWLTGITSKPGKVGFYFEVGPEAGILLSSKETVSGDLSGTIDAASGLSSFQLIGHLMLGVHIPVMEERMSIKAGPYLNAGLLNLYDSENAKNGSSADVAAIGLSICLDYNSVPHR